MAEGARLTFKDDDEVVSLARDVEKQAATVSDDDIHARSWGRLWINLEIDRRPYIIWNVPS